MGIPNGIPGNSHGKSNRNSCPTGIPVGIPMGLPVGIIMGFLWGLPTHRNTNRNSNRLHRSPALTVSDFRAGCSSGWLGQAGNPTSSKQFHKGGGPPKAAAFNSQALKFWKRSQCRAASTKKPRVARTFVPCLARPALKFNLKPIRILDFRLSTRILFYSKNSAILIQNFKHMHIENA